VDFGKKTIERFLRSLPDLCFKDRLYIVIIGEELENPNIVEIVLLRKSGHSGHVVSNDC
jgi:hypothetical protein